MPPRNTWDNINRFIIALVVLGLSVAAAFGWVWGFGI